ncbi:hypothetical protein F66182_725 [Fusarium sp. NRRL 66182]|nr:hypothetical protein F66182_725 [Fusarium sp. NRRL 66182]
MSSINVTHNMKRKHRCVSDEVLEYIFHLRDEEGNMSPATNKMCDTLEEMARGYKKNGESERNELTPFFDFFKKATEKARLARKSKHQLTALEKELKATRSKVKELEEKIEAAGGQQQKCSLAA